MARIALARPDKRNAMNPAMFTELDEAVARAAGDPDADALLVTGDGPAFCAGIDLSALEMLSGIGESDLRVFIETAQRPFRRMAEMPKPTIAAVQGHALGAGFQVALACDLRIAAADARFGVLEARYGLLPDLGGLHHLPQLIGPARAKELVWSARLVEADEAARIGLVNRVVPVPKLAEGSERLMGEVLAHSPTAARLAKSVIDGAMERALRESMDQVADAQVQAVLRRGPAGGGT